MSTQQKTGGSMNDHFYGIIAPDKLYQTLWRVENIFENILPEQK